MSMTIETPRVTESELEEQRSAVPRIEIREHIGSDNQSLLNEQELLKARNFQQSLGYAPAQRITLLGIVLASLEGVTFERAAGLLGVKPHVLERLMHGTDPIPARYSERWTELEELVRNLRRVVRTESIGDWFDGPVPALDGKTPMKLIERGKIRPVLEVTRSYLDPSFA
jgi:hypothetical protein